MILLAACFLFVLVGLQVYLRLAPGMGLIDTPNNRSLHGKPTVVGAGLVVVLGIVGGLMVGPRWGLEQPLVIAGLSVVLAAIGLADDRYPLPSAPRLVIYALACGAAVYAEGYAGGWILPVLIVSLLWLVNLFNFMDGADGFAALQAIAVAAGMGLLCGFGPAPDLAALWWMFVAGLLPFLGLNWPPARCFMGDAGSVPLGFLLGMAGLACAKVAPELGYAWLILMMPFIVDASLTLLLRLAQGHPPHLAHRKHAYQRAVRLAGSPLPVVLGLGVLHLLWQFPLAVGAVQAPSWAPILVIFSGIPSVGLLVYLTRRA